jgi:uncharacterized protein (DUF58 family)
MSPTPGKLSNLPARGPRSSAELIDAAAVMRIKHLPLRARIVVEGFYSGLHRSPFHGFSVEFSEYRQYSTGDELRYLDWRLYARSDRYYIKRFEDETNRRCYLLVDLSRSMAFGSLEYDKADYARTLAATLAHHLSLQRDNVGLVTFDDQLRDFLPARYRPGHRHQLLVMLQRAEAGHGTDLLAPLQQIAKLVRKRGLVILISDLLTPLDQLQTHLGYLRSRGHEVFVLRVLDPAEVDLPLGQAARFRDAETDREIFVDPEVARPHYQQRFAEHDQQLRQICAQLGIDLVRMMTNQRLEDALFELLAIQTRWGPLPTRRRRNVRSIRGAKP